MTSTRQLNIISLISRLSGLEIESYATRVSAKFDESGMKANLRLRRERELRAWSQAKVAEEVGTDPATVSRWERGLSFPYPYFRERLCALFQKNAEDLGLVQGLDEQNVRATLSPNSLYLYESESPIIP